MTVDYLKLVPIDPHYVPDEAAQEKAVAELAVLFPAGGECQAEDYGRVVFIDQGENFEAILCPACGKRHEFRTSLDGETTEQWWHGAMDQLEDGTTVEGIEVAMPCCSRSVPLTRLQFDGPAAFARFELSIRDPETNENLSADQLAPFERILGCMLRQVWAHY